MPAQPDIPVSQGVDGKQGFFREVPGDTGEQRGHIQPRYPVHRPADNDGGIHAAIPQRGAGNGIIGFLETAGLDSRPEVDRAADGPPGRVDGTADIQRGRGQFRDMQTLTDTGIHGGHTAGAGQVDDLHPVARREGRPDERPGPVPELLEGRRPDDAGLTERCFIDMVFPGHGAGMRRGHTGAALGHGGLDHDDRLPGKDVTGKTEETATVLDAFQVHTNEVRAIVMTEIFQHVAFIHLALVTEAGKLADADLIVEERQEDAGKETGLADKSGPAGV